MAGEAVQVSLVVERFDTPEVQAGTEEEVNFVQEGGLGLLGISSKPKHTLPVASLQPRHNQSQKENES